MGDSAIELTILMPCLNEAETLAVCIRKANAFLEQSGVAGEVVVADNGSTDGSLAIAQAEGARVVPIPRRGYGAALWGGINGARGKYVIMGDADDSYDFSSLMPYVLRLREGADLVMGNRFRGGIGPGAMPPLHRYLGNPVLSFIGRLFFNIKVGDFHCGLRGFNRDRVLALQLRTTGMEFASEMVVRAALANYRLEEVPTKLKKDGRSRPPHLRTWRDGWRHLSFLLMYSPKWLFLFPGVALLLIGLFSAGLLLPGSVYIGGVGLDIHTFAVGCIAVLVGVQSIGFALMARRFATSHGLIPPSRRFEGILEALTFERVLVFGAILSGLGILGMIWCLTRWASTGFGPLDYSTLMRALLLSLTSIAIGVQLALTAFMSAITEIPTR